MKQLELIVDIKEYENNICNIIVKPVNANDYRLTSYYKGITKAETLKQFFKSLTNNNIRYWFQLKDK